MRGKGVKMMYLIKWITFAAFDPPINVIYTKYNTNFENHILGRVDGYPARAAAAIQPASVPYIMCDASNSLNHVLFVFWGR